MPAREIDVMELSFHPGHARLDRLSPGV